MNWEKFTNRFRKDARRQEDEVDMDALWAALEPEVDELNRKGKKRRPFFFWLLFGGVLALGAGWLLLGNDGQDSDTSVLAKEEIQATDIVQSNSATENAATTTVISPNEKMSDSEISTLSTDENKSKVGENTESSFNNQLNSKSNTNSNSNASLNSNQSILNQNTNSKNQIKDTRLSNQSEPAIPPIEKNETVQNSVSKSNTTKLNSNAANPGFAASQNKQSNSSPTSSSFPQENIESIKQKMEEDILLKEETTEKEAINPKEDIAAKTKTIIDEGTILKNQFSELPSQITMLTLQENSTIQIRDFVPLFSLPAYEKKYGRPAKFQFFTEMEGGISFASRNLFAKSESANVLLQTRDDYETSLEATHVGFNLGIQHRKGFRFSTGIRQTRITERLDFNENISTVDSVEGVRVLRLNFSGDTIPIMGMIPQTTTTINEMKIYNRYTLLDIPLTVGYDFSINKKWKAGVEAGVLVNLSLKTKGIIFDETLQEINLENTETEIFKSKVGLNYHLGLSVSRTFSKKLDLFIAPSVRIYSQDFAQDSYGLSQKYFLLGGNIGVRYRW